MTILKEQFSAVCQAGAALAQAKANHRHASTTLWATLSPIVSRHQKELGDMFDDAGLSDAYERRFGSTRGERLTSISQSGRFLEIGLLEYFRGESEHYEFRLPIAYLDGDPGKALATELAHYRRVFERLGRIQRVREEAETRAENLRELARLADLLKNDPEAHAAIAAISPTEKA